VYRWRGAAAAVAAEPAVVAVVAPAEVAAVAVLAAPLAGGAASHGASAAGAKVAFRQLHANSLRLIICRVRPSAPPILFWRNGFADNCVIGYAPVRFQL